MCNGKNDKLWNLLDAFNVEMMEINATRLCVELSQEKCLDKHHALVWIDTEKAVCQVNWRLKAKIDDDDDNAAEHVLDI